MYLYSYEEARKMSSFGTIIHTADWKTEKHVPAIALPDKIEPGTPFTLQASVGKEIAHPNTTEHHITWISVYFQPEGAPNPYQVGHFEFTAHGESVQGPNEGPVYAAPSVSVTMTTTKPGTLIALSFCNIHGAWEGSAEVAF
jgi:superoxide reductase